MRLLILLTLTPILTPTLLLLLLPLAPTLILPLVDVNGGM